MDFNLNWSFEQKVEIKNEEDNSWKFIWKGKKWKKYFPKQITDKRKITKINQYYEWTVSATDIIFVVKFEHWI